MKNDNQKKQVESQAGKPCVDAKDMPMNTPKMPKKGMMK
jgi:hypothetical protein